MKALSKLSTPMCVLIGLYFVLPRLSIGILWAFTSFFDKLFHDHIWLILGIVFCPYTLLSYSIGMTLSEGAWTVWGVIAIIISITVDFWYLVPRD